MRSVRWCLLLASIAIATAGAPSPAPARDPYARLMDRADAVALGRVLEAGIREVPDGTGGVNSQAFVRMNVERWIVGPDTNQTIEVKVSPYDLFLDDLEQSASQPDRRVILYLAYVHETWWLVRELGIADPTFDGIGLEILPAAEARDRTRAIRREAEAASPESLAARADLVVVGTLSRHVSHAPGVICRVERVLGGTLTDSSLTVVADTRQDLHRGRALLMLEARPDGAWKVLRDGAGCYFLLEQGRPAHATAPPESVFARIAAGHARGAESRGR